MSLHAAIWLPVMVISGLLVVSCLVLGFVRDEPKYMFAVVAAYILFLVAVGLI